jgi:hypothetical protein
MTTAMIRFAQPGCDETIQDGYCDTWLVDMANAIRPRTFT